MRRLILKRLFHALLVLFAVSILSFFLIYVSGDPVKALVPLDASSEDIENARIQFGLDRPIYIQYVTFIKQVLKGELGESFRYRQESLGLVLERLPATVLLAIATLFVVVCVSIPLGIFTATRKDTTYDYIGTVLSLSGVSVPTFWVGVMFILIWSTTLRSCEINKYDKLIFRL